MSIWLRLGPVGISTGGGRRRNGGGGGILAGLFLLAGLYYAIHYWYYVVGGLAALILLWLLFAYGRTSARRERTRAWLATPPPRLELPGRFTQTWIARNVPQLHPDQVPVLLRELRARGWPEDRIHARVGPYIAANPHLSRDQS